MTNLLAIRDEGEARIVALAKPESGNALSATLVEELHGAINAFEESPARVLVFTGHGRHFCTGFDLSDLETCSEADLMLRFIRIEQLLARIWSASWPSIAVAQGRTMGAGADLFVACSRRIALEDTTFKFPGSDFGIVLGTRRLMVRAGMAGLTQVEDGLEIPAARAVGLGLANEMVGRDDLDRALQGTIRNLTRLDAVTFAGLRSAIAGERALLDHDLATLVDSMTRPGLKNRIVAHWERQREKRARKANDEARQAVRARGSRLALTNG